MRALKCWGLLLLCVSSVAMGRAKPSLKPSRAPASVEQAPVMTPGASAPAGKALPEAQSSPAQVLAQMQALYNALEYEEVVAIGEQFTKRADLKLETLLEGYRLLASAICVVRDPSEAKNIFRLLLEAADKQRKKYELPPETPPKILDVFRVVQSRFEQEKRIIEQVERQSVVESIVIAGGPPDNARGGRPISFRYRIKDPKSAIDTVRVAYRKQGERVFNALAMSRDDSGEWSARLGGEVTASSSPFNLEYYVVAADSRGDLKAEATEASPRSLAVAAGQVEGVSLRVVPKGVFFTGAGFTVAAAALGVVFGLLMNSTQAHYNRLTGDQVGVEGRLLRQLDEQGTAYATGANISFATAGGLGVATGILGLFFTKFSDDP